MYGTLEYEGLSIGVAKIIVNGLELIVPRMDKDGYFCDCDPNVFGYDKTMGTVDREQECQRYLLEYIRPEYTFIDIGANIGFYSALLQSKCRYVHAFEPNPFCYWMLYNNTSRENVSVYCCGLGHQNRKAWHVGFSQIRERPLKDYDCFQVLVRTLDTFGIVADIIKIDVEGMAERVIQGGHKTFGNAKVIITELHGNEYPYDELKMLGFTTRQISEKHIISVRPPLKLPKLWRPYKPISNVL